ncbi:hypothetical protein Sj15T_29980 [Sphingobium sp. TA15]|uniref:DUF2889 domain-containing protein n=1 Tax=Sphingobium indicum (strain DSM 16413 / CCM 7287 / MTCC 6362 / UT26 / NBRC 101211 / UT26S) TaxID=452662 RepID=D4YXL6_SPHIU|nr:DUF2889 domain-containing protein [Sphingobium indicum]BAI95098.1 hypothetical protein SJA_C1-02640 [Sphingobium indicum UT26S]BDD67977.1 hypothetical protein Sj15T_29980 [Sphingobium sp. TA15]
MHLRRQARALAMRPGQLNFPLNPDYGTGSTIRRVSLRARPNRVDSHLLDNFHEMRCSILHDASIVTAIAGQGIRLPTTACPGAIAQLQSLVGLPIGTPRRDFYTGGIARRHCTHLLDLAVMAIGHAQGPSMEIVYEAEVPDEVELPVPITIRRNGRLVCRWLVRQGAILDPLELRGRPLGAGFAAWASRAFEQGRLEAATILARTWLIAIGRRYRPSQVAGRPARDNPEMLGRCYAYSAGQMETAAMTGEEEVHLHHPQREA